MLRAGSTIRFFEVVLVGALCFPRPCLVADLAHIGWPRPLERLSEYTYYQTEAQKAPHGAPHGPGVAARRCPPQLPGDEIVG